MSLSESNHQPHNQRALLVEVCPKTDHRNQVFLQELIELSSTAGVEVVDTFLFIRREPNSQYYLGKGQAQIVADAVSALDVGLVIVNQTLSPSQTRNLEALMKARVLDRTGLILDIFAQRAQSYEGQLQVELAQLKYLSTRLVRGWSHLERQKGGIGLRGPGETQLEVDRRLLGGRIKTLKKRLEKVRAQRQLGRRSRKNAHIPVISLVGYTNAGKSSLFNQLTEAKVLAEDQLFATLDPSIRRMTVPEVGDALLVDTVGFIRDLPHDLIEAFQATLEETLEADILLHVVDVSDEEHLDHIQEVHKVLSQIKAEHLPCLEVYNKIDACADLTARIDYNDERMPARVWISVLKDRGIDLLGQALGQWLSKHYRTWVVSLSPSQGALRAALFQEDCVQHETFQDNGGWILHIRVEQIILEKLCRKLNVDWKTLVIGADQKQ